MKMILTVYWAVKVQVTNTTWIERSNHSVNVYTIVNTTYDLHAIETNIKRLTDKFKLPNTTWIERSNQSVNVYTIDFNTTYDLLAIETNIKMLTNRGASIHDLDLFLQVGKNIQRYWLQFVKEDSLIFNQESLPMNKYFILSFNKCMLIFSGLIHMLTQLKLISGQYVPIYFL